MALIGLIACTNVRAIGAPPTIKIGLVAPFEGLHRPLGYEALFGVKLALQEQNQGPGLNGYRVELVALNDFDDPAQAEIQAQALVADPDVLGVVGHLSSDTTLAARPVYQQANLAMSIPWPVVTAQQATSSAGVVSVAADYGETSAQLAAFSQARGFDNIAKLTDYNELSALPEDLQALQLATDGVTAGKIILALQEANISVPLFGQVDVGSLQVVQMGGEAANGLVYVSPGPAPQDVDAEAFIEAYQDLAGFPPGPRAVLAYDATKVLLDAIEQAILTYNHRPTRSEVSAVINSIERQGISGIIAFNQQGQRIDAPVWVYQISAEEYPGILIVP